MNTKSSIEEVQELFCHLLILFDLYTHYSLFLEVFTGVFGVFQLGFIFRWIYLGVKWFYATIETIQLEVKGRVRWVELLLGGS